jgi:hypothetical protein
MQRGETGSTVTHAAAAGDSPRPDQTAAIPDTTSAGTYYGAIGHRTKTGRPRCDIDPS